MPNYSGVQTQMARQETSFKVPIGAIISSAATNGSTAPEGYLICDGYPVLRSDYPELFAVIGTSHGDGTKFANGAPAFSPGVAFNLPDYRGRFLRGADIMLPSGAAGRDPGGRTASQDGGAGSGVGTHQMDAYQGHHHNVWASAAYNWATYTIMRGYGPGATDSGTQARLIISDGVNGTPRISPETRPINSAVLYYVRAY